jgi:Trypsin
MVPAGSALEWTVVDAAANEAGGGSTSRRKTLSSGSKGGRVAAQDLIAFGSKARKGQFPYVASLLKSSASGAGYYHACSATLIAPNLLLTAGKHSEHCLVYVDSDRTNFICFKRSSITSP